MLTTDIIKANADRLIEMGESAWRRSRKLTRKSYLSKMQQEQLRRIEESKIHDGKDIQT